jgi:hypothetical protein
MLEKETVVVKHDYPSNLTYNNSKKMKPLSKKVVKSCTFFSDESLYVKTYSRSL